MNYSNYTNFLFLITLFFLSSCASKKDVVYLQDVENETAIEQSVSYEPVIKCDDMCLNIVTGKQIGRAHV